MLIANISLYQPHHWTKIEILYSPLFTALKLWFPPDVFRYYFSEMSKKIWTQTPIHLIMPKKQKKHTLLQALKQSYKLLFYQADTKIPLDTLTLRLLKAEINQELVKSATETRLHVTSNRQWSWDIDNYCDRSPIKIFYLTMEIHYDLLTKDWKWCGGIRRTLFYLLLFLLKSFNTLCTWRDWNL